MTALSVNINPREYGFTPLEHWWISDETFCTKDHKLCFQSPKTFTPKLANLFYSIPGSLPLSKLNLGYDERESGLADPKTGILLFSGALVDSCHHAFHLENQINGHQLFAWI